MPRDLSPAHRKIDRANQHIADLQLKIKSFLETDFYSLSANHDDETGNVVLDLRLEPIPWVVSAIAGDAIHNLRTALQFMFVSTVGSLSEDFPMFPKRERRRLKKAVEQGVERGWPANVAAAILGKIEPHPTWYDALWTLHRLDITDKHHFLVPVLAATTIRAEFKDEFGQVVGSVTLPGQHRAGRVAIGVQANFGRWQKLTIREHNISSFEILFDKGLPAEDRPIVPALHQLSELVRETVALFETI